MLLLNEQDIPLFSMDNIYYYNIIATVDTIDLDFVKMFVHVILLACTILILIVNGVYCWYRV